MQKKYLFKTLLLVSLGLAAVGCKKKIKIEGPAETMQQVQLQAPSSQLMLPVSLPIQDVESLINRELNGVFFDEKMLVNSDGDSLYLKIERLDIIRLQWNGLELITDFPLRVEATYVKDVFGVRLKNPEPVTAEAILHLSSKVQLGSDWRLLTQTQLSRIEWKKNPELRLGPVKIDVKKPVETALKENQEKLLKNLDKVLGDEIKLKNILQNIWADIQKPIMLHKDEPQAYLIAMPDKINARLGATETGDLAVLLHLEAQLEANDGDFSRLSPSPLPDLSPLNDQVEGIELYIKASLGFEVANALLNDAIKGKEIRKGDYSLQINDARLYGTDEGLAMQLNVKGSLNGTLFFTGNIAYDEETTQFYVDALNYDMTTDNYLLESVNDLFYQQIISYLGPNLRFDAAPLADKIPGLILNALDQSGLSKKMELRLDDFSIRNHEIAIDRKGVQAVIQSKMKASMALKEII